MNNFDRERESIRNEKNYLFTTSFMNIFDSRLSHIISFTLYIWLI